MAHLLPASDIYDLILQQSNGKLTPSLIRQIHDAWTIFGALLIETQQDQIFTGASAKIDVWESAGEFHNMDVDLVNNRLIIEESCSMIAFLQVSFADSAAGPVRWDFEIQRNGVLIPGGSLSRTLEGVGVIGSGSCNTIFPASKDDVIEVVGTNNDSPPITLSIEAAQLVLHRV